jgi:hypothetical protein
VNRRTETIVGGGAAIVAVGLLAVFGYRSATEGDDGAATTRRVPADRAGDEVPRRSELVDPDYQFRLVAPDASWEVFDRAETDAVWSGRIASAIGATARIEVAIDRVGDLSLAAAADRVAEWLPGDVPENSATRWLDRDIVELVEQPRAGYNARRTRVFVRDGLLYAITIVRAYDVAWDDLDLEALWGAFSLVPGTARATTPDIPTPHVDGLGWRVRNGVWASALHGATVTPPTGWRLITGPAVDDTMVDVQLANDACGCYVTLSTFVVAPTVDDQTRTMSVDAFGGSYQAWAEPVEGSGVYQVWSMPLRLDSGIRISLRGWYPRADATAGILEVRRALNAFTFMPEPQRLALVASFAQRPHQPTAVGVGWAMRNGTYINYDLGLVLRQGPGHWRIRTGEAAAQKFDGAVYAASSPEWGIVVSVVPDQLVTLPAHTPAKWAADNIGGEVVQVPAKNVLLGDWSEARWSDADGDYIHRVAAMVGSTQAFRVHVNGTVEMLAEHAKEIDAMIAGLDLTTMTPTDVRRDGFVDRRFGYKLLHDAAWTMTDLGDDTVDGTRTWSGPGGEEIAVIASTSRAAITDSIRNLWARQSASTTVKAGLAPRPRRTQVTFAGRPAVQETWVEGTTTVSTLVVERDEIVYTLATRGTAGTFAGAKALFSLVARPD